MQISGGITINGGVVFLSNVNPSAGPVYVSGDPALPLGVIESWTSNTYMNIGLGVQTAQGNDYTSDTLYTVWQVFYAHQSVRLPVGSNRWGALSRSTGTNSIDLYAAVSSLENTKSNFSSNVELLIGDNTGSQSYSSNILYQSAITSAITIPAKRYFILGIAGGPYYRNYRKTANNYTVVNGGNAIITALNEVYWPGWLSNPATRGIPANIGGNVGNYVKLTGNIHVSSYKFEIV